MSSSSNTTNYFSECKRYLHATLFIRNAALNTFFKTCQTCRSQDKARRDRLRRERSIPSPQEISVEAHSNIGKVSDWVITSKLMSSLDTGSTLIDNQNFVSETDVLPPIVNTNVQEKNTDYSFCRGCKKNALPTYLLTLSEIGYIGLVVIVGWGISLAAIPKLSQRNLIFRPLILIVC